MNLHFLTIFIILCLHLKSTVQKHSVDLEAAESVCAELHMEMEEEHWPFIHSFNCKKEGGGGGGGL